MCVLVHKSTHTCTDGTDLVGVSVSGTKGKRTNAQTHKQRVEEIKTGGKRGVHVDLGINVLKFYCSISEISTPEEREYKVKKKNLCSTYCTP